MERKELQKEEKEKLVINKWNNHAMLQPNKIKKWSSCRWKNEVMSEWWWIYGILINRCNLLNVC